MVQRFIDIHVRITIQDGTGSITTTIDVTDTGKGADIDYGIVVLAFTTGQHIAIIIIAIDGVCSLITTTIQLSDNDGDAALAVLLDVHRDAALQFAAELIATTDALEHSTGDRQTTITFYIGILGTCIDLIHPVGGV